MLTPRSHTDCSDSRSGRRKARLSCPMIFGRESTVSESVRVIPNGMFVSVPVCQMIKANEIPE